MAATLLLELVLNEAELELKRRVSAAIAASLLLEGFEPSVPVFVN